MSVDLKEFFAGPDFDELRARCLESEGIDLLGVYCLHLGKKIGEFIPEELEFAIDDESYADESELIDCLMVRVIASMRPSPALNKPDRLTIRNLVETRPVDAMAFLVNRLHGHRDLISKRNDGAFSPLIQRLATHMQWTSLAAAGVDLKPWTHWLLEIDSKANLHDIAPPMISLDRLNNWIVSTSGTSLFMMVTPDNAAAMLKTFESWAFELIRKYEERDAAAVREASWVRGNSFTKPAYFRSWMENPEIANRKAQSDHDQKKKAEARKESGKVGRPPSVKTQKLNAQVDQFLYLLDGILGGEVETPVAVTTKPRKLMLGNQLFRNRVKES